MHICPDDARVFCEVSYTILMHFGYVQHPVRKSGRAYAGGRFTALRRGNRAAARRADKRLATRPPFGYFVTP